MDITTDFLRDEVRSGFYVPTAIKQVWASQLLVLREIDRICEKHHITYFADWGTLLGAVRHGGYIPWDDDLDICMKREDYTLFRQVADKELPKGFAVHDYERKEDHWLFLSRVVNSNQICFEEEHLNQYFNFPYMASVDIFVLDYLYKDAAEEKKRCDEVKHLLALADGIVAGRFDSGVAETELARAEALYHVELDRGLSAREVGISLYRVAEEQMMRVPEREADRIGQIYPWVLKGAKGLPKRYYGKSVRLPFEFGTIPVPSCYHMVLQNRYGDYFKVRKVWGGHDYPYFEAQKRNLQAVSDIKLPEFTYDPTMQRQADTETDRSGSLKTMAGECVTGLCDMVGEMTAAIDKASYEEALGILPECQQLAVDLGTLVETVKGENDESAKSVVLELEQFCEELYSVYEILVNEADIDEALLPHRLISLKNALEAVRREVARQVTDRREILFVATGAEQWKGFDSLYRFLAAREENDVCVVPLPVLPKNIYGQILATDAEIRAAVNKQDYPSELRLASWELYSPELHHPDIIFIQDPYDGENPCLTVPPQFYAENLRKYTSKLVYIPPYETDAFGDEDTSALYNMKHYVTTPGVVYADAVIVQSDSLRQHYIKKLTEFAGGETEEIWKKKIITCGAAAMEEVHEILPDGRKKLFFCIGCNAVCELEDKFMERLQEKLLILNACQDKIQTDVFLYPEDMDIWNKAVGEEAVQRLSERLKGLLRPCNPRNQNKLYAADTYDAYYGSPTPYVLSFLERKKPVMIADLTLS